MKWKATVNSNIEVVEQKTKGGLVWYLTSPKLPMFLPCCYYYCTPLYWWNALDRLFFYFTLHMDWVCYWKSNFQWEWKVIGYCFGFALLHPAIGFIAHKKKSHFDYLWNSNSFSFPASLMAHWSLRHSTCSVSSWFCSTLIFSSRLLSSSPWALTTNHRNYVFNP